MNEELKHEWAVKIQKHRINFSSPFSGPEIIDFSENLSFIPVVAGSDLAAILSVLLTAHYTVEIQYFGACTFPCRCSQNWHQRILFICIHSWIGFSHWLK